MHALENFYLHNGISWHVDQYRSSVNIFLIGSLEKLNESFDLLIFVSPTVFYSLYSILVAFLYMECGVKEDNDGFPTEATARFTFVKDLGK